MPYSLKRKAIVTRHASPYSLENIDRHMGLDGDGGLWGDGEGHQCRS
jgi:hypothetical protein